VGSNQTLVVGGVSSTERSLNPCRLLPNPYPSCSSVFSSATGSHTPIPFLRRMSATINETPVGICKAGSQSQQRLSRGGENCETKDKVSTVPMSH
jgi:hypothetical protein